MIPMFSRVRCLLSQRKKPVHNAHLLLVLTDHQEFKELDYNALAKQMARKMIFDTRNCILPEQHKQVQVLNLGNVHEYKLAEKVEKIVRAL